MTGRPLPGWDLPGALAVTAGAVAAAALVSTGRLALAAAMALAPVVALVAQRIRIALVLLAVSLPFPGSLLGSDTGVHLAVSDVLIAVLALGVAGLARTGRLAGLGRGLAPLLLAAAPYLGWSLVLLAAHPGAATLLKTGQRLELFLLPILIGAAAGYLGHHWLLLRAYVIAATLLAALYPFASTGDGGLGVQKNPAGQFIANALILLIAVRPLRTRPLLAAVPVLALGLLWTQSRGAVVSVAVALGVLVVLHHGVERRRLLAVLVPVAACVGAAFVLLPPAARQRDTDFSATSGTAAAQTLQIRATFAQQAWTIVHAEPVVGVGLGNYAEGVPGARPSSDDPHEVLLLQAAEGGYPLAFAFVVLIGGTLVVLARRRRLSPLAAGAAAVLSATVAHGLVDVYWVRGTPVLSWLLVGVVAGLAPLRVCAPTGSLSDSAELPSAPVGVAAG